MSGSRHRLVRRDVLRGAPKVVGTTTLARDPEAARRLWEIAEETTGVVYP